MAATIADQHDLFLPLVEGIFETPPWVQFMTALLARTHARHGALYISIASAPADHEPTLLQLSAPRAVHEPPLNIGRLRGLGLHPIGKLRPGRVYALDEMLDYDNPETLARQRRVLGELGINHGRWLRVSAVGVADAWILLTREREEFSGSAAATLSAIGPYLSAALRAFVTMSEQRLLRFMAESALGRLGVGQVALDESARVIAADAIAERHLTLVETPAGRPGRRLQLPPASAERLERTCADFARSDNPAPLPVLIEAATDMALLVQPATFAVLPGMARPTAVATLRAVAREDERRGAAVLRDLFRLSDREAALAEKLSRGVMIVEAGRQLHLTEETARNYSKRIYARTGSRGQADLVRKILCSLAPLA